MATEFFQRWFYVLMNISTRYFFIAGLAFLIFYILFRKRVLHRRIQQTYPKVKDYFRDIFYSILSLLIFAVAATLVFTVFYKHTNLYSDFDRHGIVYYILTFPAMFLIHDTYFYWMHRTIHHPLLFPRVHRTHHLSANPSPWTAYAFHPLEAILETAIIPLIAFTIPVHNSALVIFLLFQLIYNVYGHLGVEIYPKNFHKTKFGRWINTSVGHNMHHKFFKGNYGLYFLFWDRWMGTLNKNYDSTYERVTGGSIKAEDIATVS
jgi:Delta7-sterol 5-desaturase